MSTNSLETIDTYGSWDGNAGGDGTGGGGGRTEAGNGGGGGGGGGRGLDEGDRAVEDFKDGVGMLTEKRCVL